MRRWAAFIGGGKIALVISSVGCIGMVRGEVVGGWGWGGGGLGGGVVGGGQDQHCAHALRALHDRAFFQTPKYQCMLCTLHRGQVNYTHSLHIHIFSFMKLSYCFVITS
jgi:hypothetical protein